MIQKSLNAWNLTLITCNDNKSDQMIVLIKNDQINVKKWNL